MRLLLTILLLTTINATANAQLVTTLKKSQAAPYTGVLLPDQDFKNLVIAEKQASELDQMLKEKNDAYASLEASSYTKQNYFFGAGVILGVIATIAIKGK